MNLQELSRELSLCLARQVPEGLWGSGVGWSLVLCFGVAYACYYLSSIAKCTENFSFILSIRDIRPEQQNTTLKKIQSSAIDTYFRLMHLKTIFYVLLVDYSGLDLHMKKSAGDKFLR